mmetsp:Transcript_36617/g.67111  ORF Transcript_36617/g.67111 Transcript_36617/m.67111 type:complete len:126 (+) Transcript_36617:32-409(+)
MPVCTPAMAVRRILALFLLWALPAFGAKWFYGAAGESCDACCSRHGFQCDDLAWPNSRTEFEGIVAVTGQICEDIQEGGSKYDPSSDGNYCGWKGNSDEGSRCAQAGDGSAYRFCPCDNVVHAEL